MTRSEERLARWGLTGHHLARIAIVAVLLAFWLRELLSGWILVVFGWPGAAAYAAMGAAGVTILAVNLVDARREIRSTLGRLLRDGRRALEQGECELAYASYRRLLRIWPTSGEALLGMGRTLLEMGRTEAAIQVLQKARRRHAEVSMWLGMAQGRAGHLVEAEQLLREAVRQQPDAAEAHLELGHVLVKECRLEEGRSHFERAQQLARGHPLEITARLLVDRLRWARDRDR